MIILAFSSRLSNLQSSKQLMVRRSYIYFTLLQHIWIENLPWYLQIPMLKVQSWFNQIHWCIISHSFFSNRSYLRKGTVFTSSFILLSTDSILLTRFPYIYVLNLLALRYSFNLKEYLDEDKISSSATSSKEALSEETRNRLKDILPMLEKNTIASNFA